MSTKRVIFKKATCFMLILLFMLASLSTTAQASERSKTVTYEKEYTFLIVPSQFPNYMSSPSSYVPATHEYNDGEYKGTLNLKYAYCYAPDGLSGNYLRVKIFAQYSGTVSVLVRSKSVTYSKTYTVRIRPSELPNCLASPSSYVPPVYYYDDGTYKGYIYLSYASCSSPTAAGDYLDVRIPTRYSGTVLLK